MQYGYYVSETETTIKYVVMGNGKALLFLHGAGLDSLAYKDNIELLSQRYKVIAPDIPFWGGSHTSEDCSSFKKYAEIFSKFINDLNTGKVILVAHSFGGGIALELAAMTNKISKLVLINSAGFCPRYSKTRFVYLVFFKSISNFLCGNNIIALRIINSFMRNIVKDLRIAPKKISITIKSIYVGFKDFNKINVPTLIIWGKKDRLFPVESAKHINNLIVDSKIKLVDGGHDWLLLSPRVLYDLLK